MGAGERRYLLKDVDHFAGFAHAITTYVAGIALADLHGMSLIYQPLKTAHGSGYMCVPLRIDMQPNVSRLQLTCLFACGILLAS